jgi:hypothetical protein
VISSSNYPCRTANADTSLPITVTVDDPVYPTVSITANPGTAITPGQSCTLTAVVTNAISPTYQWFVNGAAVIGATNSSFTSSKFDSTFEDSVSCAVTNNGICSVTSYQWVFIGTHTAGVQQVYANMSNINVIPNPNNGAFTVKGQLSSLVDEEVTLEITDVIGNVIYKNIVIAKDGQLNQMVQLPGSTANGMYMLSLRSESDNKVFHIVVEQ